jgi:hypothetical protein
LSAAHLDQVEHLIVLCRRTLTGVRAGEMPDLDTFGTHFDDAFGELQKLGAIDPSEAETPSVRRRLRDLEQIRVQLAQELDILRSEMQERLVGVSHGKKGLKAYSKALNQAARGALRGQG